MKNPKSQIPNPKSQIHWNEKSEIRNPKLFIGIWYLALFAIASGAFAQVPATTTTPAQPPAPQAQPSVVAIDPSSAPQDTTLDVSIFGTNTNFSPDSTVIFSGEGIVVNAADVINIGNIIANITISPNAPLGPRDITVTSSVGNRIEVAKGTGLFRITTGFLFFGVSTGRVSGTNVTRVTGEDPGSFTIGDIFQIIVTIINSKPVANVDAYLLLIDPSNRIFFLSPDLTKFIATTRPIAAITDIPLSEIQPTARSISLPTRRELDTDTGRPLPIVKDLTVFRDVIKPNKGPANLGFGFFKLLSFFTEAGTLLPIGIGGSAVFSVTEVPRPPIITITFLSVVPDDIPSGGNARVIVTINQPLNGVVVNFASSAGTITTPATTKNGIAEVSFGAPSVARIIPLPVEIIATVENSTARKVVKVFRQRF